MQRHFVSYIITIMRRIKQHIYIIAAAILLVAACSACVNQNYLIFEEDEWSGSDFNGENLLLNGELEIDDYER